MVEPSSWNFLSTFVRIYLLIPCRTVWFTLVDRGPTAKMAEARPYTSAHSLRNAASL